MSSKTVAHAESWEQFVLDHGYRANVHDLAATLHRDVAEISHVRATKPCKRLRQGKRFPELFALWNGRAPSESDWPPPRKGDSGRYEWQAPEIALLATLVGTAPVDEIARILTARLRERSGDEDAVRTRHSIQARIQQIGMQATELLGGITTTQAAREIGSLAIVQHAIAEKALSTRRVGRRLVIPYEAWKAWKASRAQIPAGFVRLSTIRETLGIASDKLSEFARYGYIPTAIRCPPMQANDQSSQRGTWFIDKAIAEQLVADRHAGKPMPWHRRALPENLKATYGLWIQRRHPKACKKCHEIWGKSGAPKTFDDYARQYPALDHGAKRHLTRPWTPGLTVTEVAAQTMTSEATVRRAIRNGVLLTSQINGRSYVSRTDATRWRARRCPTGDGQTSWLSIETACKKYFFTSAEIEGFIADGRLVSKVGTAGAMRGVIYVGRHQCGQLREQIGLSEEQVSKRLDVPVTQLRRLLEGVAWRKADGIPLDTVHAVIKRMKSRNGYTPEEAASKLGVSAEWVLEQMRRGVVTVISPRWDPNRLYITEPMFRRLQKAITNPVTVERFGDEWLSLNAASIEAGVCPTTLIRWATAGELDRRQSATGWRYHRDAVRARARRYWETVRFHRATPPSWIPAATT